MMGWGSHGYGMWGNWGFGGMIMMIFFWAIIIIGAILIIRYFTTGHRGITARQDSEAISSERDPLDVLRDRYAKGEIDTKEFEERKRTLESRG